MPAYALIDALPDFGAVRPVPARAHEPAAPSGTPSGAPAPAPEPEIETVPREEMERAVAEAEAALGERLAAAHEAETAAMAAAHADEIERLRRELGTEAGLAIAARFAEAEANLAESANAVVARILGVVLTEEVTRMAVGQLGAAIREALADRETVRLRITGPLSLFEALRPALGAFAERAEFVEAPGLDIAVAVDSSLFETAVSEWSKALTEALAGARA